jgi:hypothetical protein
MIRLEQPVHGLEVESLVLEDHSDLAGKRLNASKSFMAFSEFGAVFACSERAARLDDEVQPMPAARRISNDGPGV